MSRLRLTSGQTTATASGARRPVTLAAIALALVCPLAVGACGGTKVTESTPTNTPEISAPASTVSEEAKTKTHTTSSGSATGSEATGSTEQGGAEAPSTEEPAETGGAEATEEPAAGGEATPTEEATPPAEEEAAGATGGASAP